MHVLLVNKSAEDETALLKFLDKNLDSTIKQHVSVGGASKLQLAEDDTSIVASGDFESEDQVTEIRNVVNNFGSPAFEIVNGGIVFESTAVGGNFEYDIADDEAKKVFARVNSVVDEFEKIFTTPASGIDWPETKYADDRLEIYQYIVQQLGGVEPYKDHGDTIGTADIDRIKNEKPWDVNVWNEVTDHLRTELKFFKFSKDWFADNGHVKTFCSDQAFMNYIFIDTVNDTYLKVSAKKGITIFLDVLMSLVGKSIALAGPEGQVLAIVLSTAWMVAKSSQGASSKVSTKIVEAKTSLADQYAKTINGVIACKLMLYNDWGKLQTFGQLVTKHGLKWPDDPRKMHANASVAYHRYAMQLLLPVSEWPLIVSVARKGKAHQKRRWNPEKGNYHFYTHAENQGGCKGWWYLEFYIGKIMYVDLTPVGIEAPKKLQRKLFGVDQSNIADPQLHLSAGFYLDNPWKLKKFGM